MDLAAKISAMESEHAAHIARFPEPGHHVRLIVEESNGEETRFSFPATIEDAEKDAKKAEEPGAIIGFLIMTREPGGVLFAGIPLLSLKDDEKARTKVSDAVTRFVADAYARFNGGEKQ
jgi:hypothetical protein